MALKYYDRGFVFADGQLLGECSGGSVEYSGDPIPVQTLSDDFSGITPVPKMAMVNVDSFIPATGFQFDAIKKFLEDKFITIKMQFGGNGLAMQADGVVMPPSITTSATDSSKLTFRVMCQAKPFE
jgi:hypothetical protein